MGNGLFTRWTWWFSIAILVYQRVYFHHIPIQSSISRWDFPWNKPSILDTPIDRTPIDIPNKLSLMAGVTGLALVTYSQVIPRGSGVGGNPRIEWRVIAWTSMYEIVRFSITFHCLRFVWKYQRRPKGFSPFADLPGAEWRFEKCNNEHQVHW